MSSLEKSQEAGRWRILFPCKQFFCCIAFVISIAAVTAPFLI